MAKFIERKRAIVEAIRWSGDNWDEVGAWLSAESCVGGVPRATRSELRDGVVVITDAWEEGRLLVSVGEWIVEPLVGIGREDLVVFSAERFASLYEPAAGTSS
jgi:hypothetical protein